MLKSAQKKPWRMRPFKSSDETWKLIKENADRYAGGNVSLWLREAGTKYKPPKRDLID